MSYLLADIDATCAALGYYNGEKYYAEPDALQCLKHLIWILRRDIDNHEYRRHLGRSEVLKTDLVPMLIQYIDDNELCDVLIRLLIILTNPTPLLYRDGVPKDGIGRKVYLELIDILQNYKSAFTTDEFWSVLTLRLHKVLDVDWALRSEEQNLLIERILVLLRNVLQIPSNPDIECRGDNDVSLHDEIIWALHQSGMLDLVLYVLSSTNENQYNLHALEIVCLLYREQTAESLADASLQRSIAEKYRDEQELVKARTREKQKRSSTNSIISGRHSRFGGTYIIKNLKSVSDKDIICHQSLNRAISLDFDREKAKQKRSHRHVNEENELKRRSAFSVRLCLREFCIEILHSGYNNFVCQVRRQLEHGVNTVNQDDSYLLWAIRFFMEFNRLSEFQLALISESLSIQCFHWVLMRIQGHLDMMSCDKKKARLWSKRLHIAIQTFRELLLSLIALQQQNDENALALFDMLLNNICYVVEYREIVIYLLMNYNETHSTKAYLRDVVEMANIFIKIMEKFCKDPVLVQDKKRQQRKKNNKNHKKSNGKKSQNEKDNDNNENIENLEDKWAGFATVIASTLTQDIQLPEENQPIPFDAASDKSIDDQKEDCMLKIYKFLREEKFEEAIVLLRSAREIWPENDYFGSSSSSTEDELMLLREIYLSNLGKVEKDPPENSNTEENAVENDENEQNRENDEYDDEDEEDEDGGTELVEKDFRFEDFAKKLLSPKVVRACTLVLYDWEKIPTKTLRSAVTILHRIALGCKCFGMLFQANIFRIFQQVFHAPKDDHSEELRRFGTYIVRKFIEITPNNPKIYAELLFSKTLKEANDMETGYTDDDVGNFKGAWSEEQENELRMLFEENQKNPESDKDVIDWMLDNIIDKTRTRRAVLKKLREMGLMFKAPTKKSVAAAVRKGQWQHEEDEQLRRLYDEHRLQEDCLNRIMEVLRDKHSKNNIIKRMITLGLIADKSEILPSKKQRKSKSRKNKHAEERNFSEDDNYLDQVMFGDGENSRDSLQRSNRSTLPARKKSMKTNGSRKSTKTKKSKKRKSMKKPLHVGNIKSSLNQIDERYQEAINWLKDCLTDAAEDLEELPEDEDDGVPLVPLDDVQKQAMDDPEFKKLLITLGIQPPTAEVETYWRIPIYLNASDLKTRIDILNGTYIENSIDGTIEKGNENDNNDNGNENDDDDMNGNKGMDEGTSTSSSSLSSDDDDDDDDDDDEEEEKDEDDTYENIMKKRREQFDNLMFNQSDNEDEYRAPLRIKEKPQKKILNEKNSNLNKKRGKFNIDDMINTNEQTNEKDENDLRDMNMEDYTENMIDFNSENLRLRLAELTDDSDESDVGEDIKSKKEIQPSTSMIKRRSRIRHNVIDSDSSDDDNNDYVDEIEKINASSGKLPDRTMNTGESTSAVDENEINKLTKNQKSNVEEDIEFEEKEEFQHKDNVSHHIQENQIDNDSMLKANNKRNRRFILDDDDDDNNNDDGDRISGIEEVIFKKKKTTDMNYTSTQRKKLTIIDDENEDDDNVEEQNVNDVENNDKVNIADNFDELNSDDGNCVPSNEKMNE